MSGSSRFQLVLVLLLCLMPVVSPAAVLTVRPEQFKPVLLGAGTSEISPTGMHLSSGLEAWVPVRLPIGATITKLSYYHHSIAAGSSSVRLQRIRVGQNNSEILHPENFLLASHCELINGDNEDPSLVDQVNRAHPQSDLVVRPGFTYYLKVSTDGNYTRILGVKIYFTPPAP